MHDQQILELLRSGKRDKALLRLYKHFPQVERLICSKGGSKEDARDIYQEALIIFCRKVKSVEFELTAGIGTYLYSVSRFLWKDELQRRQKKTTVDFDLDLTPQDEQALQEALERENNLKMAEQVIAGLGQRCRDLLQLFYFQSLSMKVIADKLQFSSEKIARNQKYKCMERAKAKLLALKKQATIQSPDLSLK